MNRNNVLPFRHTTFYQFGPNIINEIHNKRRKNALILLKKEQRRRRKIKKKLKKQLEKSISIILAPVLPIEIGRYISKFVAVDMNIPISKDIQNKMIYEQGYVKYKFDGTKVIRISK